MEDPERERERIVVADSNVLVRHAISDYLRHCGFSVIEASHAEDVLIILAHDSELGLKAVLCGADLQGGMNGFRLRASVREIRPDLHVILSGSIEAAANAAAYICEEGPHLRRPYDPQGVVTYIRHLLARSRSPSPTA